MKFEIGKYYYVYYGKIVVGKCVSTSEDGDKAVLQYIMQEGYSTGLYIAVPHKHYPVHGEVPLLYVPGYKPPRKSLWKWLFG